MRVGLLAALAVACAPVAVAGDSPALELIARGEAKAALGALSEHQDASITVQGADDAAGSAVVMWSAQSVGVVVAEEQPPEGCAATLARPRAGRWTVAVAGGCSAGWRPAMRAGAYGYRRGWTTAGVVLAVGGPVLVASGYAVTAIGTLDDATATVGGLLAGAGVGAMAAGVPMLASNGLRGRRLLGGWGIDVPGGAAYASWGLYAAAPALVITAVAINGASNGPTPPIVPVLYGVGFAAYAGAVVAGIAQLTLNNRAARTSEGHTAAAHGSAFVVAPLVAPDAAGIALSAGF